MKKYAGLLILFCVVNIVLVNAQTTTHSEPIPYIMPTWVFSPSYETVSARYQDSKDSARIFFDKTGSKYKEQKQYQQKDLQRRSEQMNKQYNYLKSNYSRKNNTPVENIKR